MELGEYVTYRKPGHDVSVRYEIVATEGVTIVAKLNAIVFDDNNLKDLFGREAQGYYDEHVTHTGTSDCPICAENGVYDDYSDYEWDHMPDPDRERDIREDR